MTVRFCCGFQQLVAWTSVFAVLFRIYVERASGRVHKLLPAGKVPTTLAASARVVAEGLFGLCRWESLGMSYS